MNAAAAQAIANNWLRIKLGDLPHAGDPVLDGKVWRVPIHADFPVPDSTDVLPFRDLGELMIEIVSDKVGAVGGYPTPKEREERMAEEVGRVLNEIYQEIPEFKCERCGRCCGVLGATAMELHIIDEYVRRHGIEVQEYSHTPINTTLIMRTTENIRCPYLKNNECMVYPVRPTGCRLFGTVAERISCDAGKHKITGKGASSIWRRVGVLSALWAAMRRRDQEVVD